MFSVGEVIHIADALDLLCQDPLFDLLNHPLGADQVRKFGDHQSRAARAHRLHADTGSGSETPTTAGVGIFDAIASDDDAATWQIRAGHKLHQVLEGRFWIVNEVTGRGTHLGEVVRRHVRGHAHGDSRGAIHQQVGDGRRQHVGLRELVVVVGDKIDDVFVQVSDHGDCFGSQFCFGVAGGRGAIVERSEVPVAIHHRDSESEVLGEAHERVVNCRVTVWMEFAHHLAHDAG